MNIRAFFSLLIITVVLSSCEYYFVEPIDVPVDPDQTVSFQNDIIPIFTDGDNCTSCHKSGGESPNLSASAAYNSIISAGLVDTNTPANSEIYSIPAPSSSSHNWKKYTAAEAALVLLWIEQGAMDN